MLRVTVTGDDVLPRGQRGDAPGSPVPTSTASDLRLERVGGDTFVGEMPVDAAGTYAVGSSVGGDAAGARGRGWHGARQRVVQRRVRSRASPTAPCCARVSEVTGGRGEIDAGAAFDPDDLRAGRSRLSLARLVPAGRRAAVAGGDRPVPPLAGRSARPVGGARRHGVARLAAGPCAGPARRRARAGRSAEPGTPHPTSGSFAREPAPDEPAAAPAESLGALLAAQRRRRGTADGGEDEATDRDGADG